MPLKKDSIENSESTKAKSTEPNETVNLSIDENKEQILKPNIPEKKKKSMLDTSSSDEDNANQLFKTPLMNKQTQSAGLNQNLIPKDTTNTLLMPPESKSLETPKKPILEQSSDDDLFSLASGNKSAANTLKVLPDFSQDLKSGLSSGLVQKDL